MLDVYEELLQITVKLDQRGIDYALCGGLALAVYDVIRATVDIDLLILTQDLEMTLEAVEELGFDYKAHPMVFAQGRVHIHRVSKIDPDLQQPLSLDLVLVTEALQWVWSERKHIELEEGKLCVVSRSGLIQLKRLRNSVQDRDDIQRLGTNHEAD
jgi:hypothetical protein